MTTSPTTSQPRRKRALPEDDHSLPLPRKRTAHETTWRGRNAILHAFPSAELQACDMHHVLLFLRDLPPSAWKTPEHDPFAAAAGHAIASALAPESLTQPADEAFGLAPSGDDKIFANAEGGELLGAFTDALDILRSRAHAGAVLFNPVDDNRMVQLQHVAEASDFMREMVLSWLNMRFRAMRIYASHDGSLARLMNGLGESLAVKEEFESEAKTRNNLINCRAHGGNLRDDVKLYRMNYFAARHPGTHVQRYELFYRTAFQDMYKIGIDEALCMIQQSHSRTDSSTASKIDWPTHIDLIDKYIIARDQAIQDAVRQLLPGQAPLPSHESWKIDRTQFTDYMAHLARLCAKGMEKYEITRADRAKLGKLETALKREANKIWGQEYTGGGVGPWIPFAPARATQWAPTAYLHPPRERKTAGGMCLRPLQKAKYA